MHQSWKPYLYQEFAQDYFVDLSQFLHQEYEHKTIYPPKNQVFRAFGDDLRQVKVVIVGQDPYHGPGQAHGLAFSVAPGVPVPPSLQNIFKEIQTDVGGQLPANGCLNRWARQGVLLLNNTLTVEAHKAGSHRGHGWETFTKEMIKVLDKQQDHVVFILWGRDARAKKELINSQKHLVLEAAHPSPLSAHNGFFGCRHFSRANQFLQDHNLPTIVW